MAFIWRNAFYHLICEFNGALQDEQDCEITQNKWSGKLETEFNYSTASSFMSLQSRSMEINMIMVSFP
uniref:Uncharacterized protein n=1 Tax=Anguilla anguilla TaxID=7936 RepID=A0A0E9XDH1_ANGAN